MKLANAHKPMDHKPTAKATWRNSSSLDWEELLLSALSGTSNGTMMYPMELVRIEMRTVGIANAALNESTSRVAPKFFARATWKRTWAITCTIAQMVIATKDDLMAGDEREFI
jgi:hypothetical protein